MRGKKTVLTILILLSTTSIIADDGSTEEPMFAYKSVNDFKPLDDFKSVEEFEKNYQNYIQKCLDNTYGGRGGIPCLIGSSMWDRELNIAYKELMAILPQALQAELKESQIEWLKFRDKTNTFAQDLVDDHYKGVEGTMYDLMKSSDIDDFLTDDIKNRTLFLRKMVEYYKNKVEE